MKATTIYLIFRALINILFILVSVYLAVKFNTKYLWFMTVPIVSHLGGMKIVDEEKEYDDEAE